MARGGRDDRHETTGRGQYHQCGRKTKMKSSEASRKAARWGQRKYRCEVCGHWHLTKKQGWKEER